VPQIVKRPSEAARNVVTGTVTRLSHRSGRSQAPATRTANKIEVVIRLHAERFELAGEALDKARIHGLIGKSLPLDKDSPFADRTEVRNSDIGPLCARAHVDKLRPGPRGETVPRRSDVDVVDRSIGPLVAQRTPLLSIPSNFEEEMECQPLYVVATLNLYTKPPTGYALTIYNFPTSQTIETRQVRPGCGQVPYARL
jgi:hypothetical protein